MILAFIAGSKRRASLSCHYYALQFPHVLMSIWRVYSKNKGFVNLFLG